jgi:hypothetical protein
MTYKNSLMVELMVPRDPEVERRLRGFYGDIGWIVRDDTDTPFFTYTHPDVDSRPLPTIAYWQTENPGKIALFTHQPEESPSHYAKGLRLPGLQQLVEVCLVVPTDDDVHNIFDRGGPLLEVHTHILPRDHVHAQEFRFGDPFNYSLRVTANPGWQIETAK